MTNTHFRTNDRLEQSLSQVLRAGVMLSAMVVALGGILYLIQYGMDLPTYRVFHSEPAELRSLLGITTNAFSLQQRGLIQFGLLILITTPILRVAFCAVAFARQRDYAYLTMTSIVLAVLLSSLLHQTI